MKGWGLILQKLQCWGCYTDRYKHCSPGRFAPGGMRRRAWLVPVASRRENQPMEPAPSGRLIGALGVWEHASNGDRMNTYIALFRGINVGGKNSLPMKELVALFGDIGAKNVRTYVQCGNVVFQSAERNTSEISKQLAAGIKKHHGFEPHVLILELEAMDRAIAENPFPEAEADPSSLHLGFLASTPKKPDLEKLNSFRKESERFHLSDRVFYLHAPEGVGRSKLAASSERLLGVPMTDRNWRTVCARSGSLLERKWRRPTLRSSGTAQKRAAP